MVVITLFDHYVKYSTARVKFQKRTRSGAGKRTKNRMQFDSNQTLILTQKDKGEQQISFASSSKIESRFSSFRVSKSP